MAWQTQPVLLRRGGPEPGPGLVPGRGRRGGLHGGCQLAVDDAAQPLPVPAVHDFILRRRCLSPIVIAAAAAHQSLAGCCRPGVLQPLNELPRWRVGLTFARRPAREDFVSPTRQRGISSARRASEGFRSPERSLSSSAIRPTASSVARLPPVCRPSAVLAPHSQDPPYRAPGKAMTRPPTRAASSPSEGRRTEHRRGSRKRPRRRPPGGSPRWPLPGWTGLLPGWPSSSPILPRNAAGGGTVRAFGGHLGEVS